MKIYQKFSGEKYILLADQMLTSLMNFGSILLLSSLLYENLFSNFVVLYSYSTLGNIVLSTIFSAPILVFGVKKWNTDKFNYLLANILYFTGFNIVYSIISYLFLKVQVGEVFFINYLLMNFGMTLVEILKRFIFSNKVVPVISAPLCSLLMNVVFFSGVFMFRINLSLNTILIVYWISYISASFFMLATIYALTNAGNQSSMALIIGKPFFKNVFFTHFNYAKWVLAGAVSYWGYSQGIYIFGKALGVSDFAISKLRTVQNLFGIFTILNIAMDNYLTPSFSAKALISIDSIKISMVGFYKKYQKQILFIYMASVPIMYMAYSYLYEKKYGDGLVYVIMVWLTQLIAISTKPISIALKAKEVTYPLFYSHLFAAVAMLTFGAGLILFLKDVGFILILVISHAFASIGNYLYYRKVFR